MWLSFYLGWLLGAVFLVLSGTLFARALRCDGTVALLVSPLVSIAIFSTLAIIYEKIGIPCGWATMVLPTAIAGVLLYDWEQRHGIEPLSALSISNELQQHPSERMHIPTIILSIAVALVTGVVLSIAIWVSSIPSPSSFAQLYDNGWHLTRIAQFMEAKDYSSFFNGSFYPSAWHGVAAMVGSAVGVRAPVAENISLMLFTSVVYPLSCVLLLSTLFYDRPRMVFLGSLFCLSVAFFPWRPMLWGPLYPNVAAFSVMPAETALFIRLVRDTTDVRERLLCGLVFVLGGIAVTLLQPNAVFSCGVFLIPFCLASMRQKMTEYRGLRTGVVAELLLLAVFVALWLALVYAPFMREVVWYPRRPQSYFMQAVRWSLDLCFVIRRPHYLLGTILVLGGFAVLRESKLRWIALSYALVSAIYVAAYGTSSPIMNIVSGFWYSDHWRAAAAQCVFAIPLIAYGMDVLVGLVRRPFHIGMDSSDASKGVRGKRAAANIVTALVVVAVMVINYFPLSVFRKDRRSYGFDTVKYNVCTTVDSGRYWYAPLPPEEAAFLEKVAEVTGDDLVLNQPFDGSAFAYAAYGINVEYRYYGPGRWMPARELRLWINKASKSENLQRIARELGVVYLLQLDQGDGPQGMSEDASYLDLNYRKKSWKGINGVRDDTPGFTVVLSEGDMRLYKLDFGE